MGRRMVVALGLGLGLGLGACAGADDAATGPFPACPDADRDGVCDADDACSGFDDLVDADLDTIADGCDVCAGEDDRVDVNANRIPDCTELQLRTVDLKAEGANLWRGWHSSAGGHDPANENTLTGVLGAATNNSYFVFALTGFAASTITTVTLELQLEAYVSSEPTETFSVWDVSTPAAVVEATATDDAIFMDLQSGAMYATRVVTPAQVTSVLAIPLGAQAAVDATAKLGGDFVVGLHLDTAPGWIRFGHTPAEATPIVARVVMTYLP